MNEVMVSIHCITYNHEKYIKDALEGFLMQKTDFAYEVIIHDDASTDGTADIIRDYEKKYPDIIKPIYQIENQHSKGVRVGPLNLKRARGKYIACCEGDDFWIDPNKLQKQVEYLENHPDCSLCVHATFRVFEDKKKLKEHIRPKTSDGIIPTEDVIKEDVEGYFHTTSFVFPHKLISNYPTFYYMATVGDYPLSIHLALSGYVYYIDQYMSAYRMNTNGSWTNRVLLNKERCNEYVKKTFEMLDEVNSYSGYKYKDAVDEAKKMYRYRNHINLEEYKEARKSEYYKYYSRMSFFDKIKIIVKENFPIVIKFKNFLKTIY